jgi:hypothetical protein
VEELMTFETLGKWRLFAPGFICAAATTPGMFFLSIQETGRGQLLQYFLPVITGLIGLLYSGLHLRNCLWKRENAEWVGKQIRQEFLEMIPSDLSVTDAEEKRLSEREIHKELGGVFWEAIDGYPELAAQKQFFYKNGFLYTSAIDATLILPWFAIAYYVVFFCGYGRIHTFFATICLFVAWLACSVIVPICRRRHLALSSEQLDLIRRRRREFVENRFREIIIEWRSAAPSARS